MRKITKTLVVRADGTARVLTGKRPSLGLDEVAFRLNIDMPEGWGRFVGDITVTMPEPPVADVAQEITGVDE